MAIKLDKTNIAEMLVAGTVLGIGAVAYEHRHVAKHHMRRLKKHIKKKIKR